MSISGGTIFTLNLFFRMDFSGSHSQAGDTVTLSQFFCHGENLFILVETTAPPPKRLSRKKRSHFRYVCFQYLVLLYTTFCLFYKDCVAFMFSEFLHMYSESI